MTNNIKNMPTFRGRFGTRSKRKKTNPKWDKWRYPRGIDITWRRGDNQKPRAGYGGDKKFKDLHPSGRIEVYIRNLNQLENHIKTVKDTKTEIYRLAANLGAKKRAEIKVFAEKHKLRVINCK
jgi:ribosomal protein L32E